MNDVSSSAPGGMVLVPITLDPIDRLQLIKYAGASGDFNPIHTIDQVAIDAGLPRIIAHGMLTMASVGRLFSPYLTNGFLKKFEIRFNGMVFLDDVLTVSGSVRASEEVATGVLFSCDVSATNQRGAEVAAGTAEFLRFHR
jgi:acyl dehydratase